ncbi:amidohydrolase family protein [Paenibacillus rhizoplanae]
MYIDAHQHYWKIDRDDYGWITPEIPVLFRDYLPADLEPELMKHGISRTIVVQAAPTVEETEYILGLSEQAESVAGVIGWLDLASPSFQAEFERLSRHPKFTGLRVMIQEMADPGVLFDPAIYRSALISCGAGCAGGPAGAGRSASPAH